jgi:hypothetical protein
MADRDDVFYGIDAEDRLAFVNPAWDEFAADNGARHLQSESVISRSIWEFISDDTTRLIYREILKRVRAGHPARFEFRCDSPERRRVLEMDARLITGSGVGFRVRTLSLEDRSPQPLLDAARKRSGEILRMCSWCKRVPDGSAWIPVEAAAEKLRVFASPSLPLISHGMCGECEEKMRGLVE